MVHHQLVEKSMSIYFANAVNPCKSGMPSAWPASVLVQKVQLKLILVSTNPKNICGAVEPVTYSKYETNQNLMAKIR